MRFRIRSFAALLALIALALSGAREVWASSCALGMRAGSAAEMPDMGPMTSGCMAAMAAGPRADGGGEHRGDGSAPTKAPACPFGAMMTSSACASAPALPASTPSLLAVALTGAAPLIAADQTHDLLSTSAFFRPPRA